MGGDCNVGDVDSGGSDDFASASHDMTAPRIFMATDTSRTGTIVALDETHKCPWKLALQHSSGRTTFYLFFICYFPVTFI